MNNIKYHVKIYMQSILVTVSFILLSIPVFSMTGNIIKPIFISVSGSVIICLFALISKSSAKITGNGLLMLMIFWLIFAIIKEIVLQIQAGWVFDWIYFFYFDKLLMLGIMWFVASAFFCIKRLITKNHSESDYSDFFKASAKAFLIFYIFLLVYSFVLIRLQTAEYPLRFQPFATIKEYIADYNSIPYEVFMMFFGNLLYFTPLGYIFGILLRKKNTICRIICNLLFPLITFFLLELSQFVFQNGYCEFDDMMMNSIGFWFGNMLYLLTNKLANIISKGRYNSFWN